MVMYVGNLGVGHITVHDRHYYLEETPSPSRVEEKKRKAREKWKRWDQRRKAKAAAAKKGGGK